MTTLIGTVTRDLRKNAYYVRVNIEQVSGTPLSVKATRGNLDRDWFKKGTVVEVEQCSTDGRIFWVTRIFEGADTLSPPSSGRDYCREPEPEDRTVRFYIGTRYSHNDDGVGMNVAMYRTLMSAFEMSGSECSRLLTKGRFWVVCRESQFARFLIERNEQGLPNLFQDLRVDYYTPDADHREIDVSGR